MLYSFIYTLLWFLHPLHISVTEILYDEKEKELEMVTRIFIDDLETAIRAERKMPELDLLNPSAGLSVNELVKSYVVKRMAISLDGKSQPLNFLGLEQEADAFIIYIQIDQVKKWKTMTIANTVLLDTFTDQSNIVHVTVRENVKSLRLVGNNSSGSLTFDFK